MKTIALLYHDIVPGGDFTLSGFQSPDADIYKLDCEEFRRHLRAVGIVEQRVIAIVRRPVLMRNDQDGQRLVRP